jgi:adenylate cyclase
MTVSRRLLAVFAADVEGYSRLMGADEVGTLKGLTERRRILDRIIGNHRGRIANTAGDSVLAEFGSAVDAVQCAVEAQSALADANANVPPDKRINFRIGVHIGDVMVRAGDLFGDGVNIAARLQTLAKPGAVCISGATYDQVRKVLPITFVDLGVQQVKNIQEPIRAYQVGAPSETREGSPARVADREKPPPLPDKPSIAVLPFQNISGDPEQEYFADGMVEDIITALARTGWLFVMARNSSFAYKGRSADIKQVGRELGVRYLLEGSIRRAGGRVRITGQLIEAATGGHVWADRFEGAFGDVFELQDRITDSVVGAIEPSLRRAETVRVWAKPTDNLDAYDLYLRGVHQIYVATHQSLDAAIGFLRNAVAIDPHYELAKGYLALAYAIRDAHGWAAPEDRETAIALARGAISAADDNPTTLRAAGYALAYFAVEIAEVSGGDFAVAVAALNRALRLHPNSAQALHSLGFVHLWSGETEQAVSCFVRAIGVSPRDQEMGYMLHGLGTTYLMCNRNADALDAGLRAVEEMPKNGPSHRVVIVALVRLGRLEEARQATARLLKMAPESHLADIKPPSRTSGFAEGFLSDLRLAGYPERVAGLP